MHSLPTTSSASAVKCVALKHKLPAQLRPKRPSSGGVPARTTSAPCSSRQRAQVDEDLLATVLRVALETRLRRERLRQRPSALATRALQRAVAALDEEPAVSAQLTAHKAQFGFRDALGQLGRLHHQY